MQSQSLFRHVVLAFFLCHVLCSVVKAQQPRKLAFVVGVSKYQKDGLTDLQYAHKDATDLASELTKNGFEVTKIIGNEAKHNTVRDGLIEFFKKTNDLGKKDIVLLSFSGHGVQKLVADNGRKIETPFFCVYDTLVTKSETMISLNWVLERINEDSACRSNLLIVDACRNNPDKGARTIDGGSITELSDKVCMLFSSRSGQKSFESDKVQQGVFTHLLLKGLRGEAADKRGDVTWLGLASYVIGEVPREAPKLVDNNDIIQQPNHAGNQVTNPVLAHIQPTEKNTPPNAGPAEFATYEDMDVLLVYRHAELGYTNAIREFVNRFNKHAHSPSPDAVRWLKLGAASGDAKCQFMLGDALHYGHFGMVKDEAEAAKWYQKAAEQGLIDAQLGLARLFLYGGSGVTKDEAKAIQWYKTAADSGSAEAMFQLAAIYKYERNQPQTLKLLKDAATQGHAEAQWEMGTLYLNGKWGHAIRVDKDIKVGFDWLNQSVDSPSDSWQQKWNRRKLAEMCVEGDLFPKNLQRAFELRRDAEEFALLGDMYLLGQGVEQSDEDAWFEYSRISEFGQRMYLFTEGGPELVFKRVNLILEAANQNDSTAQYFLAERYAYGWKLEKDPSAAFKWYQKAADNGSKEARLKTGECFERGDGVPKDLEQASRYFHLAAAQGDSNAQRKLGDWYASGKLGIPNDIEAAKWFRAAAENGNSSAQFSLGWFYQNGRGVQQNVNEAKKWYLKASFEGHQDAKKRFSELNHLE